MLRSLAQIFIRTLAFVRKEIFEILRQPRLIFTLVLGPFLILLIFGLGYHNEARALRTIFVAPKGSQLSQQIEQFASNLGPQLIYAGVTDNQDEAMQKLRNGQVDVVAVAPANAYDTVRSNQQAVFTLYHHEIDPFQADYVKYFGQVYVDEVNRRVLENITREGQTASTNLQQDIQTARTTTAALRTALQSGDQIAAQQQQLQLGQNVNAISLAMGATLSVLGNIQNTLGPGDTSTNDTSSAITDLQQNSNALSNPGSSTNDQLARLDKVDQDLATLDKNISDFRNIDPTVIVSPFRSETKSIASLQPGATDYYAPAVLSLLLQHLAITFAALSIVRERAVGTMELFRVSPLSAAETLFGKYISYMLFGGIIAASLALLLVYGLHVPLLGSWWNMALVITAVLFASLGIGFVISIFSQTDSQAVQFSMIVLLASVFFSGFLMSLETLTRPVRIISWLLPTTYGSIMLRDIALRGSAPDPILLGGLFAMGLILFIIAWIMLGRLISRVQK